MQKEKGVLGEQMAAQYLKDAGFEVLHTNYRFGKAEIDLIVRKESLTVFVEVKMRKTALFGTPETFVSKAQIQRIQSAATAFMLANECLHVRFDIISLLWKNNAYELTHFQDAF